MVSKIEQRYLTYRDVAKFLGVGLSTVHRLRRSGKITPKVWGKRLVRFDVNEVLKLADSMPKA